MKRTMLATVIFTFAIMGLVSVSIARRGETHRITKTAQSYSFTDTIDMGDADRVSVEVVYSSVTPPSVTLNSGSKSTATITLTDHTALQGRYAGTWITIASNSATALDDAYVEIQGRRFLEGRDWNYDLSYASNTAASLASAIDGNLDLQSARFGVAGSSVIYASAAVVGTSYNSWSITTSTPTAIHIYNSTYTTTSYLFNGRDRGYFIIQGVTLTEGTDFTVGTSSAITASSIASAINNNSTLSTLISATAPALGYGVMWATSTTNGVNRYLFSCSTITSSVGLSNSGVFYGGAASAFDLTTDYIYSASHGYYTGNPILFDITSGAVPTGLADNTTYYVIRKDANNFQLSDTSTGSYASTPVYVNMTAQTSGVFTSTGIAFTAGSSAMSFTFSNDGTNFNTDILVATHTITCSGQLGSSTNVIRLFDFDYLPYRYVKFNYTGPTWGGITMDVIFYEKD